MAAQGRGDLIGMFAPAGPLRKHFPVLQGKILPGIASLLVRRFCPQHQPIEQALRCRSAELTVEASFSSLSRFKVESA
jgi:hypothetical protein